MTKADKRLVIYIAEDEESAQFRYRCSNIKNAVGSDRIWRVKWFLKSEIKEANELLDKAALAVIVRQTAKDGAALDFIEAAQTKNVKVLFDLDDLIFDYRDMLLLMKSTNSKNILYWAGYFWGIRRIARKVDGFITTNEFLAGKLKRSFGKPVRVIRNSLNREQTEVSEKSVKNKKHDGFLVGYFSGSPTHVKDFRLAEAGLVKFLREHDDAKLRLVGEMELSGEMRKLVSAGRVKILKKVDYLKLQELVAGVDVNIAPLVVNDFTNSKSELKFFEAAAVETTTIASPAFAFSRAIKDGENGLIAKDNEWYEKLEFLYQNPEENRKMAKRAKKDALENYYGEKFLKEVEEVYEFFAREHRLSASNNSS